jgi:hypothetical protein
LAKEQAPIVSRDGVALRHAGHGKPLRESRDSSLSGTD